MGAVQHHFASVSELVRFGLQQTLSGLEELLDAATAGAEGYEHFKARALALLANDEHVQLLLRAYAQFRTLSARDEVVRAAITEFDDRQTTALQAVMELAQRHRILHELVDPPLAAEVF